MYFIRVEPGKIAESFGFRFRCIASPVKITYNLNDSPQLRLARHSPTEVTVYDDPDGTLSTTPIGAAKKKSYVGKFAELPLKVCLSALKDARFVVQV